MNQLVLLERLEKVAAIMRAGGLHSLTRIGRHFVKNLLRTELSARFDNLYMSGPIELRGFLYLARSGHFEPFTSRLFRDAVTPNSIVIDIGACIGYYSLLAAKEGAKVYAFEPTSSSFSYLVANIQRNDFSDRIVAVSKAVSDTSGTMRFLIHDNGALNSFFRNAGEVKQAVKVDTISIDEFLDDATTVNVIKMDIEGGEMHALRGMERTIARSRNLKLFVECNGPALRSAGHSPQEFVERLGELGFRVMVIDDKNDRLAPVMPAIEGLNKQVNLYCTHS